MLCGAFAFAFTLIFHWLFIIRSAFQDEIKNSHKILWFPMKRYLVPMNVAFYRRLPNEIESSKIITVTPYDESD